MGKELDLRKLTDVEVYNATILPNRPHGVFQTGEQYIPLNRAVQRLGGVKKLQQLVNRYFNHGGTSKLFGSNPALTEGPIALTGFVSTWDTELAGTSGTDQIELPLEAGGTYNFTLKYNGSILETVTSDAQKTITFPDGAGIKTIQIEGIIKGFRFNNGGDKLKITNVANWGDLDVGTSIGGFFYGCSNMDVTDTTPLSLASVPSLLNMFRGCSSVTYIATDGFVALGAVGVIDGSNQYYGCTSLVNVSIGDTSIIENFGNWFFGCSSLVEMPLCDMSSASNIIGTWTNCSSLTGFPSINLSSANNAGATWSGCSSIINFPAMDLSSVNSIASMWINCNSMESIGMITLTATCTSANSAFNTCSSLLTIPLIDFSNILLCQQTFQACNFTSFPIIDLSSMTNGANMFLVGSMPTEDWSNLLIATEANNAEPVVTWSGGNSKYNVAGGVARTALIDRTPGWTMSDGGPE